MIASNVIVCLPRIGHHSLESILFVGSVVYSSSSTISLLNRIVALYIITISFFGLSFLITALVVVNTILVLILGMMLKIFYQNFVTSIVLIITYVTVLDVVSFVVVTFIFFAVATIIAIIIITIILVQMTGTSDIPTAYYTKY